MDRSPHKSDLVNVNGLNLHFLDWGGSGDVLLFLTGLGNNAHIFAHLAPRFADQFHVMALTRRGHGESDHPETGYDIDTLTEDVRQFLDALGIEKVILAGHSMASVELSHFSALYPERVLKLIFLDAAYDRSSESYKNMRENNPLRRIQAPGLDVDYYSVEDYFAAMKRAFPFVAAIWTESMEEQSLHEIIKTPEGKIVEKMSDEVNKAIMDALTSYLPEDSQIKAPTLSFFVVSDSAYAISDDWMTEEQKAQIMDHFETRVKFWKTENIEQFRQNVPHAKIIEIPQGHHYCFIEQEELVYEEMRKFLLNEPRVSSTRKSDFARVNDINLHYLDWGGNGPVLLFLAGLGCNAHIFDEFAPRFTDRFHALGLTRRGHGDSDYPETGYDIDTLTEDIRQFMDCLKIEQAILAGHSLAGIELSHFAALYPDRVLKFVFLDAAYDRSSPECKTMQENNPLKGFQIPGANDDYYIIQDYVDFIRRTYPSLGAIWGQLMDEHILHAVYIDSHGKVVDKMSDSISKAIDETVASYVPEDAKIQAPVLSIYAIRKNTYYVAPAYMTEQQQAQMIEFFEKFQQPWNLHSIEKFRRDVPHAKIVEIPNGHHYCFIEQEELVYEEMRKFLLG